MGLCDKFFTKQPSAWNLANRLMINQTLPFLKGDRCSKPSFVFICGVHSWNLMVRPWKSHLPKRKVSSSNHHFSGESVDRHPKQPPWMYKDLVNNGINYHLVSWILNDFELQRSIYVNFRWCIPLHSFGPYHQTALKPWGFRNAACVRIFLWETNSPAVIFGPKHGSYKECVINM